MHSEKMEFDLTNVAGAMVIGMILPGRNFIFLTCLATIVANSIAQDILGCGGFLKSHADIDFTKVHVRL